jgi:hypothetical protein
MKTKTTKQKLPVITQEEANEYIQVNAQSKVIEKEKKVLAESLKTRLAAGAKIPQNAQVILKYTTPEFPTMSWRDIAFNLGIQIIRMRDELHRYNERAIVELHAAAEDPTATEKIEAETLMTLLEAENPKEERPTLSTEINPDYFGSK